ncbi:hypothetical protein P691DRAFT_729247 [Macrolepiota fuliginosa MF-IS2]|uniref:Bromo domain-containing protein n=1 Tax=Macrolepiota fuliginosa MF-IS2 TaxID=1400762 RepID=A0A9P6C4F0_9AGAR|nr:hypothetical protein P691DRAFT_729247 [Macrolepiota fuliginosa MF-IS2]
MDGSLPSPSSSYNQESSPRQTTTRSGLTLVLPSLKNLKAAKAVKKSKTTISISPSPAFDVDVAEKKASRPVKLKPLKEVLSKLIQQIKKKDDYAFFLEPVNPNQVPGYSDIIKRPMDFGTMTNKVNRSKYRSLEDFANDLKLVTTNAKIFNPSGSIYHAEADRIEAWALDHIAKASSTVIQYETDWNIDIEKDDDAAVNVDDDDDEAPLTSLPAQDSTVNGRSPSVVSQVQPTSGRRGPRGPYKKVTATTTISESINHEGRLPGSKDGLGAFPPCSDWARTMVALKLKGKRYKTKKERLRFEKEGPPYLPDGSLDYTEMEDPFSVLSALAPDSLTRPQLTPIYPPLTIPHAPFIQPTPSQTQSVSENSTPQPEPILLQDQPPTSFPSTISLPLDYDPSLSIKLEVPLATTYSKRRHWHIVRNQVSRKTKDNGDDNEADEPPWHAKREAHPADFGSFALLAGALSEEMKKRGVTPGVLKDGEEETVVFNLIRNSLDQEEAVKTETGTEGEEVVASYLDGSVPSNGEYFTSRRAAEAEEYIRDVVYGGVNGLAYVRSLAEFVGGSDPVEVSYLASPCPFYPTSELGLGMPLGHYIQNIVNELTEDRHALLRETAEELRIQAFNPGKVVTDSPVAVQTATSLHLAPEATIALEALLRIKLQKIDMSALISTPQELFLSEEEWAGKNLREKRKALQQKTDTLNNKRHRPEDADAMEVEEEEEKSAMNVDTNGSADHSTANAPAFEMEGPEELAEVLDYVAGLIVELHRRVSMASDAKPGGDGQQTSAIPKTVEGKDGVNKQTNGATVPEEDSALRNLRLNLLALAKRAPLDTIARLPLELVPEHIRHYIPTLDSSALVTPTATLAAGIGTPVYTPLLTTAAAPASVGSSS